MAGRISYRAALEDAKREHSRRPIKSQGFDEREVGPHVVNVLYFSVEHKEGDIEFTDRRMAIYVDGKKRAGVSF